MSQNIEESPVSDSKMDISEATTSQDSAGVSPIGENVPTEVVNTNSALNTNINRMLTSSSSSSSSTLNTNLINSNSNSNINSTNNCITMTGNIKQINNIDDNILKLDNIHLDNNPPNVSNNVLRLGQYIPQQQQSQNCNLSFRSELTIANSHPLMSPPGTDSDSENGHYINNHNKIFSYPDVVPQNEPLRLANPINNSLNENNDAFTTKKTVTSTSPSLSKRKVLKNKQYLDVTADCKKIKNAIKSELIVESSTNSGGQKRKISVRRDPSPDIISSESDQDISQYKASVEPNYQTATLISNNINRFIKPPSPLRPLARRKIPITSDIISDDISSLDSISNRSFGGDDIDDNDEDDDDMDHNLASLSPSSSVLDGFNDKIDDFPELDTPTNIQSPEPIPLYTAEDERRDSRNWQKITLPDGRVREIDMKVIEPYKRVLSHGGYLKAGGHNAIVMFCACHLPDRSRADYHYVMDNLFLYVVKTLEQLVTEDYVLIYLHGGSNRRNVPPFPWLKKCYQLIDRRLRKSLKNLYLVHPSFWLKSIVWMSRPFVSTKFWRKLVYVRSLEELYTLVSVEKAAIPDKVKQYDAKYT